MRVYAATGRIERNTITGVSGAVLATLKPGMYVTAVDYKGIKFFAPGTTIREIRGGTIVLNEAAIHNLAGEHTIYFADNTVVNSHRELDTTETSRFGIPE